MNRNCPIQAKSALLTFLKKICGCNSRMEAVLPQIFCNFEDAVTHVHSKLVCKVSLCDGGDSGGGDGW